MTEHGANARSTIDSTLAELIDVADRNDDDQLRAMMLRRFGFAVPTDASVAVVAAHAPNGIVEIGAGTGYWARQLANAGLDVVAYDLDPPPADTNPWFAGTTPWFPVAASDHRIVARHASRTLLIGWPTRNESWPTECLDTYSRAGGRCVVYVGDPPGGSTGTADFHARLGEAPECIHCTYRLVDVPCVCGVDPQWSRVVDVGLPRWKGIDPRLRIYARTPGLGPD